MTLAHRCILRPLRTCSKSPSPLRKALFHRAFDQPSTITTPERPHHPARRLSNTEHPIHEELYIETFGRLAAWSQRLEDDTLVELCVRHHEHRPIRVQSSLLVHAIADDGVAVTGPVRIRNTNSASGPSGAVLDLTGFETSAAMVFLFWLYNRRLPGLRTDCARSPHGNPHPSREDQRQGQGITDRETKEFYNIGLIECWRLGCALSSAKFMNDLMRHLAALLELEEVLAARSRDPEYSAAITWARRAYDAMKGSPRKQLSHFAVDVAAKRVYDVGAGGFALTLHEREALSGNAEFSAEVFASLGGQIGTSGVKIAEFAREYLVKQ